MKKISLVGFYDKIMWKGFYKNHKKDFDALEETCNKITKRCKKAEKENKVYDNEIVQRGNSIFFDIK